MNEKQKKTIEDISEKIVTLAEDYVKMEAADCDEKTKGMVLKAFVRGFYISMRVFDSVENKE